MALRTQEDTQLFLRNLLSTAFSIGVQHAEIKQRILDLHKIGRTFEPGKLPIPPHGEKLDLYFELLSNLDPIHKQAADLTQTIGQMLHLISSELKGWQSFEQDQKAVGQDVP
jgi:hypothetical protein